MTAARINMSHGRADQATTGAVIDTIRKVAETRRKLVPIILDTKGPEIRVSPVIPPGKGGGGTELHLESEDVLVLLTGAHSTESSGGGSKKAGGGSGENDIDDSTTGSKRKTHRAVVTYPYLANSIRQGDVVLLDDGRISLIVTRVPNDDEVYTQVIEGGKLLPNKGVNLPGCTVELPHLTDKDESDILFGISKNVEFIAHSFTRSATGINQIRELPGVVESGAQIIAKIESQEGLDNFASILRVSDAVMVARGDLGVEIPLERVCSVQKRLVASCNAVGKPVIVATELLDSMINHPRPTRAEASDVANAVFDGAGTYSSTVADEREGSCELFHFYRVIVCHAYASHIISMPVFFLLFCCYAMYTRLRHAFGRNRRGQVPRRIDPSHEPDLQGGRVRRQQFAPRHGGRCRVRLRRIRRRRRRRLPRPERELWRRRQQPSSRRQDDNIGTWRASGCIRQVGNLGRERNGRQAHSSHHADRVNCKLVGQVL